LALVLSGEDYLAFYHEMGKFTEEDCDKVRNDVKELMVERIANAKKSGMIGALKDFMDKAESGANTEEDVQKLLAGVIDKGDSDE
jgi:predicted ArsR family transcriptional regulator